MQSTRMQSCEQAAVSRTAWLERDGDGSTTAEIYNQLVYSVDLVVIRTFRTSHLAQYMAGLSMTDPVAISAAHDLTR